MTEEAQALAEELLTQREAAQKALQALSPREAQVLRLIVAGMKEKQIAAQLGISEKTVSSHKEMAREKTGTTSAGLVVMAARAGWV